MVVGFESFVNGKSNNKLTDHALVFMLREIAKTLKQAIAFYYCQYTTKPQQMVHCVKEVITSIQTTKLEIVATICNYVCTNLASINLFNYKQKFNTY